MVHIKAEEEMGFPLAQSFFFLFRMLQAQISIISFFSSKWENLTELTL